MVAGYVKLNRHRLMCAKSEVKRVSSDLSSWANVTKVGMGIASPDPCKAGRLGTKKP